MSKKNYKIVELKKSDDRVNIDNSEMSLWARPKELREVGQNVSFIREAEPHALNKTTI
jgi:hypothetical protein